MNKTINRHGCVKLTIYSFIHRTLKFLNKVKGVVRTEAVQEQKLFKYYDVTRASNSLCWQRALPRNFTIVSC